MLVRMLSSTLSRYEVFRALRALCSYHEIAFAGSLAIKLSGDADFVLRESGLNGIGIIYSRPDCEPETLGSLRLGVLKAIEDHRTDPHWYVRKANENAMFFQQQYDTEFLSAIGD